jgi:hypothetical protein
MTMITNSSSVPGLGEEGYRYKKAFLENLPIPPITPENQSLVSQIESLVDQILARKRGNPPADTRDLEHDIDQLVYRLYDLSPDGGSSRVDLQACKLGTGRRFTTS